MFSSIPFRDPLKLETRNKEPSKASIKTNMIFQKILAQGKSWHNEKFSSTSPTNNAGTSTTLDNPSCQAFLFFFFLFTYLIDFLALKPFMDNTKHTQPV